MWFRARCKIQSPFPQTRSRGLYARAAKSSKPDLDTGGRGHKDRGYERSNCVQTTSSRDERKKQDYKSESAQKTQHALEAGGVGAIADLRQ